MELIPKYTQNYEFVYDLDLDADDLIQASSSIEHQYHAINIYFPDKGFQLKRIQLDKLRASEMACTFETYSLGTLFQTANYHR